jgi:8-oxo-dGTP pyrophosphatase MutT (NUDIX family)
LSGARPTPLRDFFWRSAYRLGFPLARIWWGLRRRPHRGALVAIHVGGKLLLVRSSYRAEWNFPGGSIRRGETPEDAARRELVEEIGLADPALLPAGEASGIWDRRPDRVHFFELRLDELPTLRLDNQEIVGARLVAPDALCGMSLTGPVALYVSRRAPSAPACQSQRAEND